MKVVMTYFKRWPFFIVMMVFWMLFNFNLNIDTIIYGLIISSLMTIFTSQVLFDQKDIVINAFAGLLYSIIF